MLAKWSWQHWQATLLISGHKEIHEITRKRRNDASRHPISVSPRYLTTELDKTRALYPLNEATFFLAISNCHDDDGRARKCGITQRGAKAKPLPSSSLFQSREAEKKRAPCQCHSLILAVSRHEADLSPNARSRNLFHSFSSFHDFISIFCVVIIGVLLSTEV